jgi:23S rRNA pseudouridine2605 synthase
MLEERLQKYMSRCGIASRRKCEELITQGKVKVNTEIVTQLGTKINYQMDKVYVEDRLISPEENLIYVALNKPVGYLSTVKDDRNRKTIIDLISIKERIYPIGRLDYDTSGLILLTNDGNIYNNVIHPKMEVNKTYLAIVKGHLHQNDINKFETGIDIGGYITAPAHINVINSSNNTSKVRITIHEGKNRQIRRMCDAINHPVISLQRISIGNINLGQLPLGKWRYLTSSEILFLKELR